MVDTIFADMMLRVVKDVNIDRRLKSNSVLKEPTSTKRSLVSAELDNLFIYLEYYR